MVQRRTKVVVIPCLRFSRMDCHSDAQAFDFRIQCPLGLCSGAHRVCRGTKGGTEGVSDRLEDMTVVGLDGGAENGVMACQGSPHRFRMLFPEPGAALDVGE